MVYKTLETEKSGLIYEHKSENPLANELSRRVLGSIREMMEGPKVEERARLTLDYIRDVVEEFRNEVRFYTESDSNPKSYLIHLTRYHLREPKHEEASGRIILARS